MSASMELPESSRRIHPSTSISRTPSQTSNVLAKLTQGNALSSIATVRKELQTQKNLAAVGKAMGKVLVALGFVSTIVGCALLPAFGIGIPLMVIGAALAVAGVAFAVDQDSKRGKAANKLRELKDYEETLKLDPANQAALDGIAALLKYVARK